MYKRILLAYDGSKYSKRAGEHALNIAQCNRDSMIEFVYVVDGNKAKHDVLSNWNSLSVDQKRKELLIGVTKEAEELGINYTIKILHDESGPAIIKHANEQGFDIVIVGSRGLDGIQELVLGSVSHKVAKRAK
ncbi:universal stress protein [Alkalihalophilus lindianensis]|uniref:Universal stress protein n=1 Tax=Alkalihalophilus lindianensis TaxID=1630542 RepID=A0ABU3XFR9_9BACI|nr:universal stress protein [Alkalihalophilus lindianensis]MDV2686234.1 universal stress protein [Alkalihalophilus lindianensis]